MMLFNNHPELLAISTGPPSMHTLRSVRETMIGGDLFLREIPLTTQILVPGQMPKWKTFLNWRQRQRGDWYTWPAVLEPQARKDSRWDGFNGKVPGCWSSSVSRFFTLYNFYTIYPTFPNLDTSIVQIDKGSNSVSRKLRKVPVDRADIFRKRKSKILESCIDQIYQFSWSCKGTVKELSPWQ